MVEVALVREDSVQDDIAIAELRGFLRGELLQAGDEGYEAAGAIWNGAFRQRPALIARCMDEFDVIAAVCFAQEQGLPLAVRSGGHSVAGHSSVEGGLVVDLSEMRSLRIDPVRRVARVQAGATWGDYAKAAQVHGLATSSGDVASVGIGGLTLGGGIGWMVRKHGLTIDHLLAVEMVTADGRLLRASAEERSDLFWALRGGGGNFGIATAFEFRLHPTGTVLGGAVMYSAAEGVQVLRAAIDYAAQAPDELTVMINLMAAPPAPFIPIERQGELAIAICVCYAGDLEEGWRVVAPLRSLGTPIADIIGPMPYAGVFALTEAATVKGGHHSVRSMFAQALEDEALETIVEHSRRSTQSYPRAQIRILGGAMARAPEGGTAFTHRDKPLMFSIISSAPDAVGWERQQPWLEGFWQAMKAQGSGVYVNFLGDEGGARVGEAYDAATLARLAELKYRYDPANVFRHNQNIKPRE